MVHHGAGLRQITRDGEFVKQLIRDYRNTDLPDRERAMLDYAVKLTMEPWAKVEGDVASLRAEGLSDEQILAVALITCVYAFYTRLADGLGVDLSRGVEASVRRWLVGPAREQSWLVGGG